MHLVLMKTEKALLFLFELMPVITIKHSVACATNLIQLKQDVIGGVSGARHNIVRVKLQIISHKGKMFDKPESILV